MNTHADRNIDTVLTGLRTTNAPAGLETRIHARLAQTARFEDRRSFSAAILSIAKDPRILLGAPTRLAWAATATAAIAVAFLATHHQTTTVAEQSASTPTTQTFSLGSQPATAQVPQRLDTWSGSSENQVPHRLDAWSGSSETQVPQRFSVGSHRSSIEIVGVLTPNPDAIALAETLAPSHPAPPLPLTQEEALLLRATRPGQPIEVAELDSLREPMFHAIAEQREYTNIGQYIHALLGPLAAAEVLSPTPAPPDETQPVTVAEAPSSK
jgi:hypothetical protein